MNRENITFGVSEVNEYIRAVLENDRVLGSISIKGEISNFKHHYPTGHMYFSLKDEGSILRGVMFRSSAEKITFIPENGMKVVVHGKISSYPRDGQYQIYADSMRPDGEGELYAAFERLKKKLSAEGLFDSERKKPIPLLPKRVGIITSPTGAALRDMINVSGRRAPGIDIVVYPSLVQGATAAQYLAGGVKYFNKAGSVDLIIIGRGGGSAEDLWAFNDEGLARVIASSAIPIISGVGHETDFTICDFAADMRAPTPSAAAELAFPDTASLSAYVKKLSDSAYSEVFDRVEKSKLLLTKLERSSIFSHPERLTQMRSMHLDRLYTGLNLQREKIMSSARRRLEAQCARLEALSPIAVLSRGYAIVNKADRDRASALTLSVGDKISIDFYDGKATATVDSVAEAQKVGQ